nr:hypothetical protein [Gammaproteobacteria bacterium]
SMADSDFPEQRQRLLKAFGDIVLGQSSIARAVESISEIPTALCLRSFSSWTTDLIKLEADPMATIGHEPDRDVISAWVGSMQTDDWFSLYDQICRLHRIDSTSFKTQTVLEGLFADIRLKQVTV